MPNFASARPAAHSRASSCGTRGRAWVTSAALRSASCPSRSGRSDRSRSPPPPRISPSRSSRGRLSRSPARNTSTGTTPTACVFPRTGRSSRPWGATGTGWCTTAAPACHWRCVHEKALGKNEDTNVGTSVRLRVRVVAERTRFAHRRRGQNRRGVGRVRRFTTGGRWIRSQSHSRRKPRRFAAPGGDQDVPLRERTRRGRHAGGVRVCRRRNVRRALARRDAHRFRRFRRRRGGPRVSETSSGPCTTTTRKIMGHAKPVLALGRLGSDGGVVSVSPPRFKRRTRQPARRSGARRRENLKRARAIGLATARAPWWRSRRRARRRAPGERRPDDTAGVLRRLERAFPSACCPGSPGRGDRRGRRRGGRRGGDVGRMLGCDGEADLPTRAHGRRLP